VGLPQCQIQEHTLASLQGVVVLLEGYGWMVAKRQDIRIA